MNVDPDMVLIERSPIEGVTTLPTGHAGPKAREEPVTESKLHSVGNELQTDETFDHAAIIDRMDAAVYEDVFVSAITEARDKGEPYEAIRRGRLRT